METCRRAAICLLDSPVATIVATSRSRVLIGNGALPASSAGVGASFQRCASRAARALANAACTCCAVGVVLGWRPEQRHRQPAAARPSPLVGSRRRAVLAYRLRPARRRARPQRKRAARRPGRPTRQAGRPPCGHQSTPRCAKRRPPRRAGGAPRPARRPAGPASGPRGGCPRRRPPTTAPGASPVRGTAALDAAWPVVFMVSPRVSSCFSLASAGH